MIVSIDPGLNHCGVAVWDKQDKTLIAAYLVRNAPVSFAKEKWASMAYHLQKALTEWRPLESVVCELPQVYQGSKQKGDPNDLIDLALVVGRLYPDVLYKPMAWKGQCPKDVMVKRIESRLSPDELKAIEPCPASLRHNVLDAIGIGLFHLGRLQKKS